VKKLNLERYLIVEEEKIIFKLDREIIGQLNQNFLAISPNLLTNLRWYFLNQKQKVYPLIFLSYYQQDAVIKTVITNTITNQLYGKYLSQEELLKKINFAHHFLIEYILEKIKTSGELKINLTIISGIISAIIVIITIGFNWANFMSLNPLFLILPISMWWLLQEGIKRIIALYLPKFNRLIWRYLLLNKFILNEKITKFILTILGN
jgi:hypothetical protein